MDALVMTKTVDQLPLVQLTLDNSWEAPQQLARLAQEYGPVFRVQLLGQIDFPVDSRAPYLVFMVGPEANAFILHSHRDYFSHDLGWTPIVGPLIGHGLLNMDGPEHDRQRKMMSPSFTASYMARYLPIMRRVVADRTRDWAERGVIDLAEETRKITFDIAAEALVGFHTGPEVDRLRELFYGLFYGPEEANETLEQYQLRIFLTQRELNMIILDAIAQRRAAPTDDILGTLVRARDENGAALSDEQLLAHVNILLVAGHETTTNLSAWLLYVMGRHTDVRERVLAEMDAVLAQHNGEINLEALRAMRVLGWAIDETGRLHSPVRNAPRGVVKDFEFGGYTIPAGAQVRYSIAATHRLPWLWNNPDEFDLNRFAPPREEHRRHPFALLPFGGGPRICLGMHFAQVEVKAMATHILRHFEVEPLDETNPKEWGYLTSVPMEGIRVHVNAR